MKEIKNLSNPFTVLAGTPLYLVNAKEVETGEIIAIKKDGDITFGFSQENEKGIVVHYKTIKREREKIYIRIEE